MNTVQNIVLNNLQVSTLAELMPALVSYCQLKTETFKAGQISLKLPEWRKITSGAEVLCTVAGENIEFTSLPQQISFKINQFSEKENGIIDLEIQQLLGKDVIVESSHEQDEFISPIFLRPKPDGSHRLILNLKKLDENVVYRHFKMDSIWTAISLMKPNCYMASIDLKDAYYSVRVSPKHQKYLKFLWNGTVYKFTCLPNGLALCPRKFTKLMKPVFSYLRQQGHTSSPYIDDSILLGDSYNECASNVIDTVTLLDTLGFVPHPNKSVFIPTQILVFLGFRLNSIDMTVSLTPEKASKLKSEVWCVLSCERPTIREIAQVIGLIISSFPGVMYGPLHFRVTEHEKSEALKQKAGDFDATMSLTPQARNELQWWVNSIDTAVNEINRPEPQIIIHTDASTQGWGCAIDDLTTGGLWTASEKENHINYLEMLAVLFSLQAHKQLVLDKHVKVLVDNTTVQVTLNKMGTSHSPSLNTLVKTIWDWCIPNRIWLTVARIPGKENVEADFESRKCRRNTEWSLNKKLFRKACKKLDFTPNIDLFASRINYQLKPFISYHPDPEAHAVNAFHLSWRNYKFYAFPPFSIISQVLQKIQKERSEGLVLLPKWPTQTWWPVAMKMLVQRPVALPADQSTLYLPNSPDERHPLYQKMTLLMCHLSGNTSRTEDFLQQLPESWKRHGDLEHGNSMNLPCQSGNYTVVKEKLICFSQL